MFSTCCIFKRVLPVLVLCGLNAVSSAATLTLQTTSVGPAPAVVGYNSGHFVPGSNTSDWWRYAGVNGARVFLTPSLIEPSDDSGGHGDGVTDQPSFLARKAALRADPLNPLFINWTYFTSRFGQTQMHGSNLLEPNHTCRELRTHGVNILVCLGATEGRFPITSATDWAGKWELWQHYYAEAFYLGREFQVQRFQMYNEPNHNNAIAPDSYLERLKLVSDAVQCAQADVNRIYGTALAPQLFAPVTAGTASSTYATWGRMVVTNRHTDFLGNQDPGFWLLRHYNYHQYNSTPSDFGANLATLHSSLAADMTSEPRLPTAVSEFNVHTASTFHTLTNETLDSPSKYARYGAIVSSLANNAIDELYCFKFSQTHYNAVIPVKKNGMHYVDNTNAPYNIGGITKAGEVHRLFALASSPGAQRLSVQKGAGTSGLYTTAFSDHSAQFYHLFSANYSSANVSLDLDTAAWNLPAGQLILLREVSELCAGGGRSFLTNTGGPLRPGTHPSNTVWLLSAPRRPQEPVQTLFASADAMVKDGTDRTALFGSLTNASVGNSVSNSTRRSAALMKFQLPVIYKPDIQFALLAFRASATNATIPAQAHVYALTNVSWSESSVSWSSAPNLAQNRAAGADYTNNVVLGSGISAFMAGQVVADAAVADRFVDVTDSLNKLPGREFTFLIAREVRRYGEVLDDNILNVTMREAGPDLGPRLLIVRAKDSDGDGIGDDSEIQLGTNPNAPDTDSDGVNDGEEILVHGTDPGRFSSVPPTILSHPVDQVAGVGDSPSFTVHAQGSAPLHYEWYFNGTNALSWATNATLTVTNAGLDQAGAYHVIVTNNYGTAQSSSATLYITNPPAPPSEILVYEPFPYEAGSSLAGQGGWLLNAGSSAVVEAGNLQKPELAVSAGNRLSWGNASMSLRLPLGTNVASGEVLFSFVLRIESLGSFANVGTLAGFTTGTGTSFGSKINIRTNGAGGYNLGTSKLTGTTYGDWSPRTFLPGQDVFVVARYAFHPFADDDTCDLWLDPDPASLGALTPPLPDVQGVGIGGPDLAEIDRFFFRSGGTTSAPLTHVADELRLGTMWAHVTTPLRPVLQAVHQGGQVLLKWPANFSAYRVEAAPAISSAPAWQETEIEPQQSGDFFVAAVTPGLAPQFYRLVR